MVTEVRCELTGIAVLGYLDEAERDRFVTQRSRVLEHGRVLGLANANLDRRVRKGPLKVRGVSRRRYGCYLTPRGFAEKSRPMAQCLSAALSLFRQARSCPIFAEADARYAKVGRQRAEGQRMPGASLG